MDQRKWGLSLKGVFGDGDGVAYQQIEVVTKLWVAPAANGGP